MEICGWRLEFDKRFDSDKTAVIDKVSARKRTGKLGVNFFEPAAVFSMTPGLNFFN